MFRNKTRMTMLKQFAFCVIFVAVSLQVLPTASAGDPCTEKAKRCTCKYPGMSGPSVNVTNTEDETDYRTVGLAGATGALGGLLATVSALTAYFHFQGTADAAAGLGDMGGGGGGWGNGGGVGGGGGGGGGYPRPVSTGSSDSFGSESPLTKHGDKSPRDPSRPPSVSSVSSSTNIYKQSKVWPGRF